MKFDTSMKTGTFVTFPGQGGPTRRSRAGHLCGWEVVEIADAWTGLVDTDAGVLLIGEEAKTVRKGEGEWQGVVIYRSVRSRPRRLYQ